MLRDRLSRPMDSTVFIRRRSIDGTDEPHTFRWGATPMTGTTGTAGGAAAAAAARGVGRLTSGIQRVGYGSGRTLYGSRAVTAPQNTPAGSGRRAHGTRSLLPSWYPRRPLNDITSIVQAIERRIACLGEVEGQEPLSPLPHGESSHDTPFMSESGAPLEHNLSVISPTPTISRHCPSTVGKVPKILLDIANQDAGHDCLTPQKKLLNSIEKVEKVVMEELERLKRTPTARRAEREKKAIERRAHLREVEGQEPLSPLPHGECSHDTPFMSESGNPLKHNLSVISPTPTISRHCPSTVGKVPKILLDIANQDTGHDCLTPQKKLLNSIKKVEKVVMEELERLKRTPIARRAEREKKVRTLMSMC